MSAKLFIPRRAFLASFGLGAAALAVGLAPTEAEAALTPLPNDGGLSPSVFIHVAPSGLVTIVCHRSEMGQGIKSSLPVLIADELGADMAQVKILQGDGDPAYGDQNTDGSTSVRRIYEAMRRVGATARTMLVAAAAKKWRVPASACEARDHAVFHASSKRRLGFGELAIEAAKLPVPKPADVLLRPRAELKHVGTALPLLDGPDVVTGRAVYGADVRLPGMLIAVVARPPVVGGKVAQFDGARATAMPGVKRVVELPAPKAPYGFQPLGGVAVIAESTWAAMRGRDALDITWEHGDNAGYASPKYREALTAAVRAPGQVVRTIGDADAALAKAARRIEAEYHVPHLAHAAMEPPAAVARVTEGGCEVWASTQNPQSARAEVAKALGIDPTKVVVHVTLLGGGFGRKSKPDFIVEAALLSRAVGAPVRVQWTREDDIRHGYFHTTSAQRLVAGLDERGKVAAWLHRAAFPSIQSTFKPNVTHADVGELQQGMLDFPLAIPNVRGENGEARAHVRIGWMRSVCNIHHAFAIGSFIDEIAHARGEDPRDVWLEIIGPKRWLGLADLGIEKLPNYGQPMDQHPVDTGRLRAVVERVTAISGWDARKKTGRALGLAAHRSFLSYVAVVVSVTRDARGKVHVDEAWVVVDAGTVINADRVRSQMEGAVLFGMSLALRSAITVRDGAIEQSNFRDYAVARIGEAPRAIHVEIVPSDGAPGGIGEPGVPPVAPAIANAVFALTGTRVRELPMVKAGLA
ncbi:Isoquinoline 1-oxidoreductase beta subunit protein [Minicystis rosea]|nr:Isoquinoline 1-oxidoreductase beta subunit protein [Minicystis rosea]